MSQNRPPLVAHPTSLRTTHTVPIWVVVEYDRVTPERALLKVKLSAPKPAKAYSALTDQRSLMANSAPPPAEKPVRVRLADSVKLRLVRLPPGFAAVAEAEIYWARSSVSCRKAMPAVP